EEARRRKYKIDWETSAIAKPNQLGVQIIQDFELSKLEEFIDWGPFFRSWDLHGKYPNILTDEVVGEQATELFKDAKELLKKVVDEKLLKGKGVFGLFPANTINDDDIEVTTQHQTPHTTYQFLTLRQQLDKRKGIPNISLADFIAPKDSEKQDYIGC